MSWLKLFLLNLDHNMILLQTRIQTPKKLEYQIQIQTCLVSIYRKIIKFNILNIKKVKKYIAKGEILDINKMTSFSVTYRKKK